MNNTSHFSIVAVLITILQFHCTTIAYSAEKKPIEKVDVDALTVETQKIIASTQHAFNLVWVIPIEFWQASFSQDKTIPKVQRQAILKELNQYMIVGVVRGDISPIGFFSFHDEKSVFNGLHIAYITGDGKRLPLKPQRRVDNEAQLVIDAIKPILRAAMGKMGENFHLFACDNTVGPDAKRISAYEVGTVSVTLDKAGKNAGGTGEIAFPLDSLHVPRKCPKCTKQAHISWKFCPWCGTRHDQ